VNIPLFHSKTQPKHLLLIAIETGHVSFSIADLNADLSERFVYLAHYGFTTKEAPSGSELARLIISKIDTAFDDLLKQKANAPLVHADVLVSIGSPWHVSWSEAVSVKKDKAFKVTQKLVDEEVEAAFQPTHQDFTIIGTHIMGYKMNGYAMRNPFDKQTTTLELHAYVESAPREILDPIKNSIRKHTPHSKIYFSTSTFSAVETVKEFTNSKDFLLVLPENEVTDIVLVRDGFISTTASIPFGSASLARELFSKDSSGIDEAMQKAKKLRDGTLNAPEFARVTAALGAVKLKFINDFRAILWKMNESLLLPGSVFVADCGFLAGFISEWLSKEDYSKETFTLNGFTIKLVTPEDISQALALSREGLDLPFSTLSASVVAKQFETNAK